MPICIWVDGSVFRDTLCWWSSSLIWWAGINPDYQNHRQSTRRPAMHQLSQTTSKYTNEPTPRTRQRGRPRKEYDVTTLKRACMGSGKGCSDYGYDDLLVMGEPCLGYHTESIIRGAITQCQTEGTTARPMTTGRFVKELSGLPDRVDTLVMKQRYPDKSDAWRKQLLRCIANAVNAMDYHRRDDQGG